MPRRKIVQLFVIVAICSLIFPMTATASTAAFTLNLGTQGAPRCLSNGGTLGQAGLIDVFNGFGTQCINKAHELVQQPAAPTSASSTHAALAITKRSFQDRFVVTVSYATESQLRADPNPWEVGWVLLDYVNVDHFYGVILKPTGWEIEKEWCNTSATPCQSEQFLAMGSNPIVHPGQNVQMQIAQTVVDGTPSFTVSYRTSTSRPFLRVGSASDPGAKSPPYVAGRVGLYDEEASVAWRSLLVRG